MEYRARKFTACGDNNLTTYEHCEKAVVQLSENGEVINQYKSARQASEATGIAFQNISKVVRGNRPRAGGFRWKYL